jgi:hypothetical protein
MRKKLGKLIAKFVIISSDTGTKTQTERGDQKKVASLYLSKYWFGKRLKLFKRIIFLKDKLTLDPDFYFKYTLTN